MVNETKPKQIHCDVHNTDQSDCPTSSTLNNADLGDGFETRYRSILKRVGSGSNVSITALCLVLDKYRSMLTGVYDAFEYVRHSPEICPEQVPADANWGV